MGDLRSGFRGTVRKPCHKRGVCVRRFSFTFRAGACIPFARRLIMRRTVCLLAALLVLPALGSDTPKEYDEKITLEELDGVWRATGFGQEEMTCRGGDFAVEVGIDIIRGKYRSDNSCNPRHLD